MSESIHEKDERIRDEIEELERRLRQLEWYITGDFEYDKWEPDPANWPTTAAGGGGGALGGSHPDPQSLMGHAGDPKSYFERGVRAAIERLKAEIARLKAELEEAWRQEQLPEIPVDQDEPAFLPDPPYWTGGGSLA